MERVENGAGPWVLVAAGVPVAGAPGPGTVTVEVGTVMVRAGAGAGAGANQEGVGMGAVKGGADAARCWCGTMDRALCRIGAAVQ